MALERKMDAVLFDLDGTLIFHEQTAFLSEYFKHISEYMAKRGYDARAFVDATYCATGIVLANNGQRTNKELFWDNFFKYFGRYDEKIIEISDEFYVDEFKKLRKFSNANPNALKAVELAHMNGKKVVLATNPVFPMVAQLERLSWSGLTENDFDLITSYENSCFCKPNPKYFLDICQRIDVEPQNAIIIGNDEREDMKCGSEAGLMGYLATDCRIIAKDFLWTGQRGTFEQALRLLNKI